MRRHVISPVFAFFLFGLTGCTTTSVYTPDHLSEDEGRQVSVHLRDGTIIRFASGNYGVVGEAQDSLSGTGQIVTNSVNNASAPWDGSIPLNTIESVTVTQLNLLGNAAWIGAVGLGVWTLTHLSPFDGWRY